MSVKSARLRRVSSDVELTESLQKNWLFNFKLKRPFYFNPKHREFYNCIKQSNTKMGFVDGPAGSMKTYIAVYAGLELLKQEQFQRLVYIRSVTESAERSLGSLPGEIDEKFSPYAIPLEEKITEISDTGTYSLLKQKGMIEAIPVNFVRGLTFSNTFVIQYCRCNNITLKVLNFILMSFQPATALARGTVARGDPETKTYAHGFALYCVPQTEKPLLY